jgi:hypothetical protein
MHTAAGSQRQRGNEPLGNRLLIQIGEDKVKVEVAGAGVDAGVSAGDVETAGAVVVEVAGVGVDVGVGVETVEVVGVGVGVVGVVGVGVETVEVVGVGAVAGVGVGVLEVVGTADALAEFEGEGKVDHVTITVSSLFVPRKGETPRTTWTWIMLALIPCFSRNPATFSARRNARAAEVPGPLA